MTELTYCCESSVAANEPLTATAPQARYWLLVEYRGDWGPQALDDSSIPTVVKSHLMAAKSALQPGNTKTLLIRHPQEETPLLKFIAADALEGRYFIYNFTEYRDLLQLDILDSLKNARHTGPLYLICTNGNRDAACGTFGTPVFDALWQYDPDDTWRCSHIGGHRFAPTGVFLPHGVVYGRLQADSIVAVAKQYENDRISRAHLRGRSIYPAHVQAALAHVAAQDDWLPVDQWELAAVLPAEDGAWRVSLRTSDHSTTATLTVRQRHSDFKVRKSTTDTLAVQVPVYDVTTDADTSPA